MRTLITLLEWLADERFDNLQRPREPFEEKYRETNRPTYRVLRHRLCLNSGDTISLQYSQTHYCNGTNTMPDSFELWCCPPSILLDGFGSEDDPYAFVPLNVVVAYIDSLGGIVPLKTQLAMKAVGG
jgi:hypothetical protein